jgi:hypothetical protein
MKTAADRAVSSELTGERSRLDVIDNESICDAPLASLPAVVSRHVGTPAGVPNSAA